MPFYHEWMTPECYFTDPGRELPPGCEEIEDSERRRCETTSREVMQAYSEESHSEAPTPHPSLVGEE